MKKVRIKAYPSSDMVLLAFDWEDGKNKTDFLGFAIKRQPGFKGEPESWLPNRLTFNGPAQIDKTTGKLAPATSNNFPIQKFMWWDARFNTGDTKNRYTYTVYAVTGTAGNIVLEEQSKETINVTLLDQDNLRIKTFFNRAVVSSQSFSNKFIKDGKFDESKLDTALEWLSNGLGEVIPKFIAGAEKIDGAIYHLRDKKWIIPAFKAFENSLSIVHHSHPKDTSNDEALSILNDVPHKEFWPRTHTSIMHNKFLVASENNVAKKVLMGSANFTTEGLTEQANLYHIFESPELATLYLDRKKLLETDPTKSQTQKNSGWSDSVKIGAANVKVCFFPEKSPNREGMNPVINAITNAKQSVLFCLFSPTDRILREALFSSGDRGKMMFGLVNHISDEEPVENSEAADVKARIDIYHRNRTNKDVYDHHAFSTSNLPPGFWWELNGIPKNIKSKIPPVFIHHKFILIDAETEHPVIYTGSANMSNNSNYNNDENLIEISHAPEIGKTYLAEFMRLYEHYRARVEFAKSDISTGQKKLQLDSTSSWSKEYYISGNPKSKSRIGMVQ